MSEKLFRAEFIQLTRPLDPWAIENVVGIGTPDVSIAPGWVELKIVKAWPVRSSTPVALPHYTDCQRHRLLDRWNAGGGAWLAMRCRKEWFLFDAPAAQRVGYLTRDELKTTATRYAASKPTSEQLCSWFIRA